MSPDANQPTPSRRIGTLVAIGVGALVVLMVVLHLTGVVGANSH